MEKYPQSKYNDFDIPDSNLDIKFNISSISKKEAEHQYYNFILLKRDPSRFSLLYENSNGTYLTENNDLTVPLNIVKKDISNIFGLHDWQFKSEICCNNIACAFFIPTVGINIELLIDSMKQLGWYKSRAITYNLYGYSYTNIKFEPLYSLDITNEIHNIGSLYHISPISNHLSIRLNGFIPQHKNTEFDFPPRIYFLTGNVDEDYIYDTALELSKYNNISKYIIYTLDTNKIPKFVKFQANPNLENSVYTTYKIPYKVVSHKEKLNLNDFR